MHWTGTGISIYVGGTSAPQHSRHEISAGVPLGRRGRPAARTPRCPRPHPMPCQLLVLSMVSTLVVVSSPLVWRGAACGTTPPHVRPPSIKSGPRLPMTGLREAPPRHRAVVRPPLLPSVGAPGLVGPAHARGQHVGRRRIPSPCAAQSPWTAKPRGNTAPTRRRTMDDRTRPAGVAQWGL